MESVIFKISDNLSARKKFLNYRTILFTDVLFSAIGTCITLPFVDSFIINIEEYVIVSISVCSGIISLLFLLPESFRRASIKSVGELETAILLKQLSLLIIAMLIAS